MEINDVFRKLIRKERKKKEKKKNGRKMRIIIIKTEIWNKYKNETSKFYPEKKIKKKQNTDQKNEIRKKKKKRKRKYLKQ